MGRLQKGKQQITTKCIWCFLHRLRCFFPATSSDQHGRDRLRARRPRARRGRHHRRREGRREEVHLPPGVRHEQCVGCKHRRSPWLWHTYMARARPRSLRGVHRRVRRIASVHARARPACARGPPPCCYSPRTAHTPTRASVYHTPTAYPCVVPVRSQR